MSDIQQLLVYRAEGMDPYRNLAMEELLLSRVREGELLLYLWQNDHTIVIGKNQDPWQECRVTDFLAAGGRIARRLTGGGAVYHDAGNLNFSFLAAGESYDRARHRRILLEALAIFGVSAEISGRNDLTVQGRKFSGNAYYDNGRAKLHHGTLLISGSGEGMDYLTPDREKLARHSVASVRSRILYLCELVPDLTPEKLREAVVRAAEEVCGCPAEYRNLSPAEREELAVREKRFASPEWIFGEEKGYTHTFHRQTEEGPVTVHALVRDGVIEDAVVYTDAMDPGLAERVRDEVRGQYV